MVHKWENNIFFVTRMDCISLWTQQIYDKTFQKWTRKKFSFNREKIVASIMKKLLVLQIKPMVMHQSSILNFPNYFRVTNTYRICTLWRQGDPARRNNNLQYCHSKRHSYHITRRKATRPTGSATTTTTQPRYWRPRVALNLKLACLKEGQVRARKNNISCSKKALCDV